MSSLQHMKDHYIAVVFSVLVILLWLSIFVNYKNIIFKTPNEIATLCLLNIELHQSCSWQWVNIPSAKSFFQSLFRAWHFHCGWYRAVNDLPNFVLGSLGLCRGTRYTRNSGSLGGKSTGAHGTLLLDLFWNEMSQTVTKISLAVWKIVLQ